MIPCSNMSHHRRKFQAYNLAAIVVSVTIVRDFFAAILMFPEEPPKFGQALSGRFCFCPFRPADGSRTTRMLFIWRGGYALTDTTISS